MLLAMAAGWEVCDPDVTHDISPVESDVYVSATASVSNWYIVDTCMWQRVLIIDGGRDFFGANWESSGIIRGIWSYSNSSKLWYSLREASFREIRLYDLHSYTAKGLAFVNITCVSLSKRNELFTLTEHRAYKSELTDVQGDGCDMSNSFKHRRSFLFHQCHISRPTQFPSGGNWFSLEYQNTAPHVSHMSKTVARSEDLY